VLTALCCVLATLVGAGPVAAEPGVPPGEQPASTLTYEVRTRGTVYADLGTFRRIAESTFNDRRGWSLGGSLRFQEVASGGAFTLWLASPSSMSSFSSVCSAQYSCRVGRNVVINDDRWRGGTPTWPAVREYRHYVLNHELGHWMGLGHTSCGGPGRLAPVMQQQSISLGGCTTNTWPLDGERSAAAANRGVWVRSEAPDVYAVKQAGATGTEVHVLDGAQTYRAFQAHLPTALGGTDPAAWAFAVADRNRDGVDDLVGILRDGASGRTEVHVLDGASGFRSFQAHLATALHPTAGPDWSFDVDDVDGDGHLDVLAIKHSGASGSTEVHVLDGALAYSAFSAHIATALHVTSREDWELTTGHHDRDGVPDLYAIKRSGASGRTEIHVLDGASGFRTWSTQVASALHPTDQDWDFRAGDHDGDGWDDLVVVKRTGAADRTEVHVLTDRTYGGFDLHTATALHPTGGDPGWRFDAE
jgi:hypothetical protein